MQRDTNVERAVELLQELGLKEYEARCFVALTRMSEGTAKDISEVSAVPRTRVYDATGVLEERGLVIVQHSTPQVFRALPIDDALATLRADYESRAERLREIIEGIDAIGEAEADERKHEVWTLTGATSITNRAQQLLDEADREIILVVAHESAVTDAVVNRLEAAHDRGVTVRIGAASERLSERIETKLPGMDVYVSGLEWLRASEAVPADGTEIEYLLLIDDDCVFVSTFQESAGERTDERAVFGRGLGNGFVALARRLLAAEVSSIKE